MMIKSENFNEAERKLYAFCSDVFFSSDIPMYLAGSFVSLWLTNNESPKDLDIFVRSFDNHVSLIRFLRRKPSHVINKKKIYLKDHDITVDIHRMRRSVVKNPSMFDFTVCCAAISKEGIFYHEDLYDDFAKKQLRLIDSKKINHNMIIDRLAKYINMGFCIDKHTKQNLIKNNISIPQNFTKQDVSIITTCKGRLHHLKRTLNVGLGEKELILVDYDDPDASGEWVEKRFPNVKVVRPNPIGAFNLSHARNCGAMAAKGEVFAFIDADITPNAEWLDLCLNKINRGSVLITADRSTKDFIPSLGGTCVVLKKEFHKVNGFNECLVGYAYEDVDFYRRVGTESHFPCEMLDAIPHDDEERMRFYQNKKTVVIACQSMDRGGAERVSCNIIDALTEDGWNCKLVVDQGGEWSNKTKASRVENLSLACSDADVLMINLSKRAYTKLPNILKQKPLLVVVGMVHDENSISREFVDQHFLLTKIITVSHRLKKHLINMGVPKNKIQVRHWGVDTVYFSPSEEKRNKTRRRLNIKENENLILWVGRFAKGKHPDIAVKTLSHLSDNTNMVFVGKGAENKTIKFLSEQYSLEDRITIIENAQDDELPGLYNAADVTLLTSSMEACPLVLQESMACGTPVVASDIGAMRELVLVHCGALVASREPREFAEAIKYILKGKP